MELFSHYEKGFDTDPGPREMQLVLVLVWHTLKVSTHPVHAHTHINLCVLSSACVVRGATII